MSNLKDNLPRDGSNSAAQLVPAKQALAVTYDTTISTSTEIVLDTNTSLIEVVALSGVVAMRWGADDASTSDFDHIIPENTTRHFAVPYGITAVNFIQVSSGAAIAVSEF